MLPMSHILWVIQLYRYLSLTTTLHYLFNESDLRTWMVFRIQLHSGVVFNEYI